MIVVVVLCAYLAGMGVWTIVRGVRMRRPRAPIGDIGVGILQVTIGILLAYLYARDRTLIDPLSLLAMAAGGLLAHLHWRASERGLTRLFRSPRRRSP